MGLGVTDSHSGSLTGSQSDGAGLGPLRRLHPPAEAGALEQLGCPGLPTRQLGAAAFPLTNPPVSSLCSSLSPPKSPEPLSKPRPARSHLAFPNLASEVRQHLFCHCCPLEFSPQGWPVVKGTGVRPHFLAERGRPPEHPVQAGETGRTEESLARGRSGAF